MDSTSHTMFETASALNDMQRKPVHIPYLDVDDLAYTTRQHDPKFIASITNIMQVPQTITLNNGSNNASSNHRNPPSNYFTDNATFPMELPDRLTADLKMSRNDNQDSAYSPNDSMLERMKENDYASNNLNDTNNATATPPSTPTKISFIDNINEEHAGKTPQIAADLYKRMRPRRSSLELDLQAEIRILRDRLGNLEHNLEVNSRSVKLLYAVVCGYVLVKTFTWLINK